MRSLVVVVALACFVAGCGDDSSSCAGGVQPHVCIDPNCCDFKCHDAVDGKSCIVPGYVCELAESDCTCELGDLYWHCQGTTPAQRDLAVPQDLSPARDLATSD